MRGWNNGDRSRYYGVRAGDYVRHDIGFGTPLQGLVVALDATDNNAVYVQETGMIHSCRVTPEHCKVLIKVEDVLVILQDMA